MHLSTLPPELVERIMKFLPERQNLLSFRLTNKSFHDCLQHYREKARPSRRCRDYFDVDALRVRMRKRLGRVSEDITEARTLYDRIAEDETATEDEKVARKRSVAEELLRYVGIQHVTTYLTKVLETDEHYMSEKDLRWTRELLALCIRAHLQEGSPASSMAVLPFKDWILHDVGTWSDERFSGGIDEAYTATREVWQTVGDEGFLTFFKAYLGAQIEEEKTDFEWVTLLVQPLYVRDTCVMDDLEMAARLTREVTQAWNSRSNRISEYNGWAEFHATMLLYQVDGEPQAYRKMVKSSELVKFCETTLTTLRQRGDKDDEGYDKVIASWESSLEHARGLVLKYTR
jgi:hypothetical protein